MALCSEGRKREAGERSQAGMGKSEAVGRQRSRRKDHPMTTVTWGLQAAVKKRKAGEGEGRRATTN